MTDMQKRIDYGDRWGHLNRRELIALAYEGLSIADQFCIDDAAEEIMVHVAKLRTGKSQLGLLAAQEILYHLGRLLNERLPEPEVDKRREICYDNPRGEHGS